jgi:hypothetical protein
MVILVPKVCTYVRNNMYVFILKTGTLRIIASNSIQ